MEFWTDRKYYKNVVKLTTELGFSWGEDEKEKAGRKGNYIRVRRIASGKFHRYSGWTFADYFKYFDVTWRELIWGNVWGFLGFVTGVVMALARFARKSARPDVIFLKGGFVGLPVGIAARIYKIPYVIHESDTVPGLANRVLMGKAKRVAFGMPLAEGVIEAHPNYEWVGVPVADEFKHVSETEKKRLKKKFGFDPERPLVVVTGGSQGAQSLDMAMKAVLEEMLKFASVGLVAGRKLYEEMTDLKRFETYEAGKLTSDFRMWEFCTVMHELMGAADVVVSRAGATTIAELATLGKAVILVPYERLPGAHQMKNAERLEAHEAAVVVNNVEMEDRPELLLEAVLKLVRSPKLREDLAKNLSREARTGATVRLAEIVYEVGKTGN